MTPLMIDKKNLQADPDVKIGYVSNRLTDESLVVGAGAHLRSGTIIYAGSRIGARLSTGHNVVLREECDLGDDVSIWSNSVVDYGCRIASRVKIHAGCYVAQYSDLEDDVFLAPGVVFANDLLPGQPDSAQHLVGPTIEVGAQLGANVTVLPGIRVGKGAIIGAGAVVTRDIPAGKVAYGCPAIPVRSVNDLDDIARRPIAARARTRRLRGTAEAGTGP